MLGIFLDQETTGLDSVKHSVIEIACVIVDLATGELVDRYCSTIYQEQAVWDARDILSIAVNGFSYEEILEGKPIKLVQKELVALFAQYGVKRGEVVFICQNPSFDRAFFAQIIPTYMQEKLQWPYHWLDLASMYWVRVIDKVAHEKSSLNKKYSLSKDTIAAAYAILAEEKPHKAMQGVEHLLACYTAVVGFPENNEVS